MEQQFQQYLKELVGMLKNGGQFAMEQLPLFVQEYLTYYTYYHGLWFLLSIGLVIFFYKGFQKYKPAMGKYEMIVDFSGAFCGIGVIAFAVSSAIHLSNFIQVTVAPRLYLVENLLQLVK